MKHVISVITENRFGVLSHVSGLFSARGFNITSLAVGETDDPTTSRMTIVVDADDKTLEQIMKQLNKLIDVIRVTDLTQQRYLERELVLVKVDTKSSENREHVVKLSNTIGAKVIDVSKRSVTLELAGDEQSIKSLFELLKPFGIKELVRSGEVVVGLDAE